MPSHRLLPSFVAAFLVILSGGNANAQTIAPSSQPYPSRIVNGVNLGSSTRPQNQTPLGISNEDCLQDTTLQFTVSLAHFTGSDSLEVWGSLDSDCTALSDRGIGVTSSLCWGLRAGNITAPIVNVATTLTFNVRVQDLVGWQQTGPGVAEASVPPAKGKEACNAQPTSAAVPMNINFIAVDSSGNVDGTPYQYRITTDLVSPAAPAGVNVSMTGADLLAAWTPNTDKDTVGYDVFFASTPAPDGQAGCSPSSVTRQGNDDPSVSSATVGSYDLGRAQSDTHAAVIVSAVDALGNVSQGEMPTCDSVGTVEADAHGVSCAVAAPGEPGAAIPYLGLLAAAWGLTRLARRRAPRK